jgi:4-methylaminobutanoate oxidase (formaldehyde-forming)
VTTSEADAVVIGAGALGVATAYHLARLGVRRVALIDRFAPASQTSPRAAGLFKLVQADETRTRLARLSVQKVTRFKEETGVPLDVVQSGSLMIARTEQHAGLVREEARQSQAWGVAVELVDGDEAHRLLPPLETPGIRAACYVPGDVYIEEPSSLLHAYLEACRRQAVGLLPDTPVVGVRVRRGRVEGVVTAGGEVRTPIVVDAAGAWSGAVAALAGVKVPIVPVRHQLYITEPVAGIQAHHPILRVVDTAVYVRPARGGLLLGGFESDPMPVDPLGADFSVDDVPLDLTVLRRLAATVAGQVPAVHDAGVREHRGGLFTMTADGNFMVGPTADVQGFWSATGCNGSGFSLSPAIGQVLAEWITTGTPSIDLSALRPARFAATAVDDDRLRAAAVWQYAHYYDPAPARPAPRSPAAVTGGGEELP